MNEREIATARRLIAAKGRDIELVTITAIGDAWDPTQSTTTATVKAVQVGFTSAELASGLVSSDDVKYLIDADVAPTVDMRIVDGVTYSIKSIMPVKPGSAVILYKVVARG